MKNQQKQIRDDAFLKRLGERIKEIRKSRGISQEELSNSLNVPPSTIGRIERGESNPKISLLLKISERLKTSLPDLFTLPPV